MSSFVFGLTASLSMYLLATFISTKLEFICSEGFYSMKANESFQLSVFILLTHEIFFFPKVTSFPYLLKY